MSGKIAPRVLIVESDQWRRAMLRAALLEAGYDAIGSRSATAALRTPIAESSRGPVRAVVVDSDVVAAAPGDVSDLRSRFPGAAFLLIARPTRAAPQGEWSAVLRRPVSVQEIMDAVRRLAPVAPE